MKKIYTKLAASVLSILVALTMIVGASYAWLTLSTSPEVNGISVMIGGGRTILLAPDITENVNGTTVHYPGEFSSTLNFSQHDTYDYLSELSGLSPVSTADGLSWLMPEYEEGTGALKDYTEFSVDNTLQNANVTATEKGSYIYLDFWIVSPGSEYNIRIATDTKEKSGSYLIELPGVQEDEKGKFQLADTQGIVEASARVGFLVNTESTGTEGMTAYTNSDYFNAKYTSLQGIYQEKGQQISGDYQFTIYEPNATSHPSEGLNDGDYIITKPLSYNRYGNTISEADVSGQLLIQTANTWKTFNDGRLLDQIFQTALKNNSKVLTAETAASMFYEEYLQGQIGSYVESGNFYKSTAALYAAAQNGVVSAGNAALQTAGATDDVKITTLPVNTPQRIRMYIWLEGQDADCTNTSSVEASGFSLNIELSGADQ